MSGIAHAATSVLVLVAGIARAQEPLRPKGVTAEIEKSIERGLAYLARNQNPNGAWRSAGRRGSYPCAMTALAGMAMLGSGSTPTRGKHWLNVRRAANFLVDSAQSSGLITVVGEEGRPMYGHGFSTMFLAQIYGMEEDARRQRALHGVLSRAIRLTGRSQSQAGGWLYSPDSNGDEGSVTVTQIQALRACRNAGITVPDKIIQGAVDYVHKSANPDGSIRYSVHNGGGGRAPITAAAVAVLYNAGRYDDPIAEKALVYAKRTLPVNGSGSHHFYAQLYLAQALYQKGGEDWDAYYRKAAAFFLERQNRDGSWQGDSVGPVYGTALALTILQLPYSYVPIYQR